MNKWDKISLNRAIKDYLRGKGYSLDSVQFVDDPLAAAMTLASLGFEFEMFEDNKGWLRDGVYMVYVTGRRGEWEKPSKPIKPLKSAEFDRLAGVMLPSDGVHEVWE